MTALLMPFLFGMSVGIALILGFQAITRWLFPEIR